LLDAKLRGRILLFPFYLLRMSDERGEMTGSTIGGTASSSRRIAANIGWMSAGNTISLVLSAAYGIALPRLMGPSLFGDYSYLVSLLALAAPIASFGLPVVLVREMSNRRKESSSLSGSTLLLFFSYLWPRSCSYSSHLGSSLENTGSITRYAFCPSPW
jgi:hypothetical protein